MSERDHITFRAGDGLKDRLDTVAERYGMDRSPVIRLLLQKSVTTVEEEGLDALVGDETAEEQPAD